MLALGVYAATTVFGYVTAYLLRFEFAIPERQVDIALVTLPLIVGLRLVCALVFRLSTGRWRFVGTRDVVRLFNASTVGSVIFLAVTHYVPGVPHVPLSVILLEWMLSALFTGTVWFLYRMGYEHLRQGRGRRRRRMLIVGAGEAAQLLVHEMYRSPKGYLPVGMVDDDPFKWGTSIHGVRVIGSVDDLPRISKRVEPDEIVIAVPSASPAQLRRIVGQCEVANVSFKLLPGIEEVLDGRASVDLLRSVEVEDLLARDPVELELPQLREDLEGKVVLITGAAGSIGAELAHQIALHGPRRLVLFDLAETPLYYLDLELRDAFPDLEIVPIIGDVAEGPEVEAVFDRFGPSRVFHAAAYKHVPMMESNPGRALRSNFLGTWQVARAAGRHGCERFVLVSTDKAVEPANVMGASKRLAEMVVLHMQRRYSATAYGAVRFGNVLGSSGSVIPLFRKQLEENKPLTLTHPEVTRFFMTIPEAVQLILRASLLPGFGGHIAMLEMGEPVKIVDLARNLLRLSGKPFRVGQTVTYTGLRPGEKLHERLTDHGERTVATSVEKIHLVVSGGLLAKAEQTLERWLGMVRRHREDEALAEVRGIFPGLAPGYEPDPTRREAAVGSAISAD